jgi:two-component system, LytTR family, sensor kinase
MKRPVLHLIFWLAYGVQDILVQFTFMQPVLHGVPVGKQFLMDAQAELILLPLKVLVAYFAMYVFLPSILNEKKRFIPALLGLMGIVGISVILDRVIYCFYVAPVVYERVQGRPTPFGIMNTWLALLDLAPIAALAVVIKFVRIQFRSREKERSLMKAKLETELKFLRNQTNPHFLFHTLESIYTLALRKSDDTPEVIMKLSKLLNFMLYESRNATIGMGDEMQMLDNYIELESIRFDGKREIDFIREIDNEYEQIAPLLLLSLVQHAFWRGDSESLTESYIEIDIKLQSGVLLVAIETPRGEADRLMPDDNAGLSNIRRQIELLYTDYSLDIEDGNDLFKAGLAINLNSHAEI